MEEDNQTLMKFYEAHTSDIAALRVLTQERKYKDIVFAAMEAKTASTDAFLKELIDLTGTGRGLRVRRDANSVKCSAAKSSAALTSAPVVTMDEVRDAVQRQRHALEAARRNEEKQTLVIRALEEEVASLKLKGRSTSARSLAQKRGSTKPDDVTADEDCCLPGTAKELRDAQRRIRGLERQLSSAMCDAKDAAAAVASLQQQCTVHLQSLQCRDGELTAMRSVLDSKEQLITALEEEVRKQRSAAEAQQKQQQRTSQPGAPYARTNSAPAATHHNRSGDEASSDRLIVTHHYRLFGGQTFVDGNSFSPKTFKDAFLRSVSTLLQVPYGYLTSVEVRTHSEAVSVEFDVRHSARIKEDEIDFFLLSHDYPELTRFLDKAKAELATRKPLDRNAVRVKELEAALAERADEVDHLRRTIRSLEASLDRRDSDRAVLDTDVDAALRETEMTVKEVYEALQATQQEAQGLQKALTTQSAQLRLSERAKAAATAAAEKLKTELATLQEQLATAQASVEQAREEAVQKALQRHTDEKAELLMSTFRLDVALPTALAQRTANRLLEEAQQARVLQALLLCHAARTAGAVPVAVKKCSLGDGATTMAAAVALAFYASKKNAEAVEAEIAKKLSEDSGSAVLEYLRMCSDSCKREAAILADAQRAVSEAEQRAAAAIAAMQGETQQAQNTQRAVTARQLQEIHARLSSVLPGGSAEAKSVLERIEQLVSRLTEAESTARCLEEESRRATQRLAEAQQEREQLQQTLSDLTARCTEMQVAKEQLAVRAARAESQLRNQQLSAGESEGVLVKKVKLLEEALRAKTAAADSEKDRMLEEHRAAATLAEGQLAEVEEALAIKEAALAQLQSKTASPGSGAAASASTEEAALREALRLAKQERAALARQVREMDTDMNDLSNIQASMQRELEVAQQELRAKKHDFDLLVKQLIRMEEREKKWASEHSASPKKQDEDAELDDVARESLVVLTNSNATLQQCLHRLHSALTSMGMEVSLASSNAADSAGTVAGAAHGRGGEKDSGTVGDEITGVRRSGHRKSALGATVSRAAIDHQKLSAQVADLLLPVLEVLKISASSRTASGGCRPRGAAAAAATAPADAATTHLAVATQRRIVKHSPSSAPLFRTASTPAAIGAENIGHPFNGSFTIVRDAAIASNGNTPKRGTASDAAVSAAVTGSGGKASMVDEAPRLDFHRQASLRTYIRSNTATSAPMNAGGTALPPASAAAAAAATTDSSASSGAGVNSSGAATRVSGDERKEEKGKERLPRGASGGGGAAAAGGASDNASLASAQVSTCRNAAPTAIAKANLLRRMNTTATTTTSGGRGSGSAMGTSLGRTACGYRRVPTVTDSSGSSASLTRRARPTHM
ncbi:conserved hypothetical protein [Leishmania infantum JPCM5]|uniref:Flagellar attachment zone protein 1 conserved domain-containing protein n=2 Tax=Leishmania infantum TaxID=5671 RepID=A4HZB9_LEIIN|nr:conserved hypothetical protein [Leishmania infantum JPCM5]CAC9486341.1 hypothetical_protein_-_conserved [Leishmania infantum]CAM67831.1 conserved hypothetical protein [Leishmania infantum JPCM5]SUZ41605.1 hypothetical_protein_-_conserved [Leishmania infantum]|eukprot:XP_001465410.1 conserved hypothetical protein [Leishmania infantum JPCM5]